MKVLKNFLINAKTLISIFFVIAIISVSSVIIELQQSKKETLSLLEQQGHTLLESLLEASKNTLLSNEKIENELKQRLIDNGKMIRLLFDKGLVTNKLLNKIAKDNKIFRINIFNNRAEKIFSSTIENDSHKNLQEKFNPRNFLQPILDGETDTLIIGLKPARYLEGNRFVVALAANNKSVIVLNVDAKTLLEFRKQVGFGMMIRNIVDNKLIEYIAVQNEDGIIAGSGRLSNIDNYDSSDIVQKTLKQNSYLWQIAENNGHKIFEALHPLKYKNQLVGIFRLGLSLEPLNLINERTERRLIFLSIVLFIFGTITIVLIFMRQNFESLTKKFASISSYSRKIFDNVSDAIFVIDENNQLVSMNKSAEEIFDTKLTDSEGKFFAEVFPGGCKNILENDSKYFEIECRFENRMRMFFISRSIFIDEKKSTNKIYIMHEITDKKILETQIIRNERLAALSDLASAVAHEIRNPLNSIGTITQQLGKDFTPVESIEEYKSLTNIVYKEVRRINEIVENFLKYSRPKPLNPENFMLSELLDQIKDQYESMITNKGLKFRIENDYAEQVFWDRAQITQVIINLLENAIDATTSGEIKILIRSYFDKIEMVFSDTGKGISEENLSKIFNLYFTTKENGSGIGLSLVHKIISEHNGTIEANSIQSMGTSFRILFPQNTKIRL